MVVHKSKLQKGQTKQFTKTTDIKVLKAIGTYIMKTHSYLLLSFWFLFLKMAYKLYRICSVFKVCPICFYHNNCLFYFSWFLDSAKERRYSGYRTYGPLSYLVTSNLNAIF